jgi:molybdate transport system permease protein
MTVAENIAFALNRLSPQERHQRTQRQLELTHIADLAGRYPRELSGGQRQRVALARALAIKPDALLLDEPFAALDPHLRRQMEEQLRETLSDYNGVVFFVTHDMEEAFRFCSELVVLEVGQVIASGPKHDLFERPRTVAAARLTGCKNIVSARQIEQNRIAIDGWECELATRDSVPDGITHLGVRSHQLVFTQDTQAENTFPCWPVTTSEAPHEMTVYLQLHKEPQPDDPPHLQADIAKDRWRELSEQPLPWHIRIDPARLLLLES